MVAKSALFGSTYVDVPQTGVAVRRMQSDMRFIALRFVPRLVVKKPSGLYTVVNMADLNRDEMDQRGPTGTTPKIGWRTKKQAFDTDARALRADANDAEVAASDVETNPEKSIPRVLGYKALIHMERRMSGKFFGAAHPWHRTITGAAADNAGTATAKDRIYMDNANADPVEAFTDEIRILSNLVGADPMDMTLAFGNRLWHKVRNHAKVKAQISSSIGSGLITMARQAELPEFAKLLGIKQCYVSNAIFNSALRTNDENEEPTNEVIVPQDEALLVVNPYAGEQENPDAGLTLESDRPAAFARFEWNGVASNGVQVRRFRDEDAGPGGSWVSVIDVYHGFGPITTRCGTIFRGMVTP